MSVVILSGDWIHIIARHGLHVHHWLCVGPLQETLHWGCQACVAVVCIVVLLCLCLFIIKYPNLARLIHTGLPQYNAIFGVHRLRPCCKGTRVIMRLFTLEQYNIEITIWEPRHGRVIVNSVL